MQSRRDRPTWGLRSRFPRRGAFVDLAAGMGMLGLLIGAVFPLFVRLLGVPAEHARAPQFWAACVAAGLLLAVLNWCLARQVIGLRLRLLAARLTHVGQEMSSASRQGEWSSGLPQSHRLAVSSADDLGRTASAFNDLLDAVEQEHRFRSVIQAASEVICLVDAAGRVSFASASLTTVLGWPVERVVGRHVRDLVDDRDADMIAAATGQGPAGPTVGQLVTVRVVAADGSLRRLEVSSTDHRHDPRIASIVLTARDITDRFDLQRRLAYQAAHDELTGLPNRSALLAAGRDLLEEGHHRAGAPLTVVLMDLDRFKEINDTLGHSYGDRLLAQIGPRLQPLLREGDVLARLGGDEFAVLMPGLGRDTAESAARRLLEAFTEPFAIDGLDLDVEASIGVAVGDQASSSHTIAIDTLLREADIALYAAKEVQSGVEIYNPGADTHTRSRLVLLTELRRAVAERQLVLWYQPKVNLATGALAGVEALLRWEHPARGLLEPVDFLPIVEHTGLITPLTEAVLDMALAQAAAWLRAGHPTQVAVNLSARCLHHFDFPDVVREALARHDVPASLLRLEITESALMSDPRKAMGILQRLHEDGVRLSIDDFGSGFSSMTYLKRFPVDELKIDRSFIMGVVDSAEDAVLVRSAIDLGHNMGLDVVAEGIENASALRALRDLGCDIGQGFHFARPAPAGELEAWRSAPALQPSVARV